MPPRLKSLELQGYKTFASRSLFEFAGMVTAIVGPNGSGKSNIADSLRWVLGEQSYTLLRAKKTEDMIFAGSEHRARAGMAQATITFDNADGWLPIDFSEVAITRRAYRDGQNEYLINKQRVRLKDVTELLAQSGLAERTYTIIGQGLVDAALALKAEERRRLFEEASGTGLHRARREEALRRLETTRRNLERVEDILAELQPRLRSLERQARRAAEYEQLMADLRLMLREWYGYHWHRVLAELSEAREAAQQQESVLERARAEHQAVEEQMAGLRDRIQSLRLSLNSWHRQLAQLHARREEVSRELAVAGERLRLLEEQRENTRLELARLDEELGMHQERVEAAQREVERLDAEMCEARNQVDSARQALAARQAERAKVEKELQAARQALNGLSNRQHQLQARLAERQAQAERAEQALAEAGRALQAAEKEAQAAAAWVQDALEDQRQADEQRRTAETAFEAHRSRVAEVDAERKKAQEAQQAVAAELAGIKARLDVLEQAEAGLAGYARGTRLLLEAARQSRWQGSRGALSSFLEVPAEYETAISAALGQYLDSVLLDENLDSALDLLEKAAARGVLLPLKSLKPEAPLSDLNGLEGVIGPAAGLVKVPPELLPVIDLLLGNVVIVRDRAAARRALAQLPPQARVVTLRGELFLGGGPVLTLGSGEKEDGGQTLLSRQRQRRELNRQADDARRRAAALQEQAEEAGRKLQALQADGERLAQAQRQARQACDQAGLALNQARLAEEQALRQAKWQREQRDRQQAEIAQGEKEAARLANELAQAETETGKTRELLREHNARLAALALDELQAQVAHWNTQAAVAERALADGKARLRERQAAAERASRRQHDLNARLKEIEQNLASLETGKAARRQAEAQVGAEIEALRALIEPAESELEALEKEQAARQTVEASARQALTVAEHRHAQARILLAKRQEALESLRRRIEDDFGLVAFEYTGNVSGPTPLPLDGMVEQLPRVEALSPKIEETIKHQRAQLRRMGAINPEAQAEYQEVQQRYKFLTEQVADLRKADEDVRKVIAELDEIMQREFRKTYEAVNVEFKQIFTRLFGGGSARLALTDPDDLTNSGIDIEARLPGRRTQGLSLLSGGERSLTAVALVFALLKVSPTPFCVLDEVDAMLDEANVGRFRELLRELSANTQFVVVTHNRNTVQVADIIYGITMGRDSASQVISLKLDEVGKVVD